MIDSSLSFAISELPALAPDSEFSYYIYTYTHTLLTQTLILGLASPLQPLERAVVCV